MLWTLKLKLIRSHRNRVIGFALLFDAKGESVVLVEPTKVAQAVARMGWRICDACTAGDAVVFCRTHALYLCDFCLPLHHNHLPEACEYNAVAGPDAIKLTGISGAP
jgi:hypothetical protein